MLRGSLSVDSHSSTQPAAVTSLISILKRYAPEIEESGWEGWGSDAERERIEGEREAERRTDAHFISLEHSVQLQ